MHLAGTGFEFGEQKAGVTADVGQFVDHEKIRGYHQEEGMKDLAPARAKLDAAGVTRAHVYGHSMGGRLTTQLTGIDARVKAAVPSCGGSGDFTGDPATFPGGAVSKIGRAHV